MDIPGVEIPGVLYSRSGIPVITGVGIGFILFCLMELDRRHLDMVIAFVETKELFWSYFIQQFSLDYTGALVTMIRMQIWMRIWIWNSRQQPLYACGDQIQLRLRLKTAGVCWRNICTTGQCATFLGP